MIRSRITGIGFHVPPRVVTNHDLEQMMDTTDTWIVERTGIRERHFVEGDVGSSDLGIEAARKALADAGRTPADVDFVIFATTTADWMFPGNGVIVQEKLGLGTVGALDVRNACSGFLYSLSVADAFVRMGQYRCVLVIGAEVQSTGLDLRTEGRDMAVLFGDGAGAAVVEPSTDESGILSWSLHSEGQFARELWCEAPSSRVPGRVTQEMLDAGRQLPRMNGRQVFKNATTRFPEVIHEVLAKAGHTLDEVALVVPHQANQRIGDAVVQRLGVPPEKVFQNVQRYGNTTAASIPIALTEARDAGLVKKGDLVVLAAFGAGFAWAGTAMRW
ncbi:MAG: ketoacyl-ACP synthase III [Candidatus Eisenbacteria bacterium]|uniref:Beta-ketoacyl-[acyl-carrier-protein] synthase III n=1 Tax=Eiseniibacteriota bacterium TaxID=2212470 RepID=A0A933S997_UNCEI|nr:ketoacyl-ACP synthase III [Candidatus Eisenbacteria bacterium]